jgi:hypothetical protein
MAGASTRPPDVSDTTDCHEPEPLAVLRRK